MSLFNKRMFARQLMYLLSGGKGPFSASRRKSDIPPHLPPSLSPACSLGIHDRCNNIRPEAKYLPCYCRCHKLTNTQP